MAARPPCPGTKVNIALPPFSPGGRAMASDTVRWRNVREFLDDLPKEHCRVKPDHQFCTVCLRINYLVAQDCPLFHLKPKRKKTAPPPPPEARPEPMKDHLTADDVNKALKGEDFPIIEFAGPRGTMAREADEDIFEVKPIDVKPMAAPPTEAMKKPAKKRAEEDTEAAEAKPATAVSDRDPESIVQEIMEELEFPDEEDVEEEGLQEEAPEVDEEDGPDETEGPPVVKKEAVKKRRPKE